MSDDCSPDQAVLAQPPDIDHTTVTADVPNCSDEVLHELPELSKYTTEGGYPKELLLVAGLGVIEDTVPDVPKVTILTSTLKNFHLLLVYRAEYSCTMELQEGNDTFWDGLNSLASTTSYSQVPAAALGGAQEKQELLGDTKGCQPLLGPHRGSRSGGQQTSHPGQH